MGFYDFSLHVAGFIAPALALALLMPLAGRWVGGGRPLVARYAVQAGLGLAVGVIVQGLALWYFGRDGKLASYAALVLALATTQWLASGAWRR